MLLREEWLGQLLIPPWALKAVRAASTSVPALASGKEKLASSSWAASKVEAHDVKKAAAAWSEVERRPRPP